MGEIKTNVIKGVPFVELKELDEDSTVDMITDAHYAQGEYEKMQEDNIKADLKQDIVVPNQANLEEATLLVVESFQEWLEKKFKEEGQKYRIIRRAYRRRSGVQYGYDVGLELQIGKAAYNLGFECKNYNSNIKERWKYSIIDSRILASNIQDFFIYSKPYINNRWVLISPFGDLQNDLSDRLFRTWNLSHSYMHIFAITEKNSYPTCEDFFSVNECAYKMIYPENDLVPDKVGKINHVFSYIYEQIIGEDYVSRYIKNDNMSSQEIRTHLNLNENGKRPSLFISYNNKQSAYVDELESQLKENAKIIRYTHNDSTGVRPWESFREFMKKIRQQDFAVLVLSKDYLESDNCIYEVMQLWKDEKTWDEKVMYIILDDANIYDPFVRVEFVKYWESRYKEFLLKSDGISITNAGTVSDRARLYQSYAATIGEFLEKVADANNPQKEDAAEKILERIKKKNNETSKEPSRLSGINESESYDASNILLKNPINMSNADTMEKGVQEQLRKLYNNILKILKVKSNTKSNIAKALLALLFLLSFFAWFVHENYVYVPRVTNMSMDNAIQTLASNSLKMELQDGQEKDLSKVIVNQEPSEGTLVKKGSFVICKYETSETSVRESYDSEGYLHSIFENNICNRYFENEICFLYADYDRDGSFEAYAVTGNPLTYSYENAKCYEDVNIYFINSDGKITKVAEHETGYNGCDAYSESNNNLLDTGSDQFFVWEWYSGGIYSQSFLYGVRDGVDYSPKCSGYFLNFQFKNDHYEALLDYPDYAHDRDQFLLMYDDAKREFVTIARTFREDEHRQLKSLNRAPGLKIQNGSVVNIDYSELNNEAEMKLLGTSGAGVDVMVGSDTSIGDFEKQLVGHKVGETFTIFVDVPNDYYISDIAGKTVQFEITVNGIYI